MVPLRVSAQAKKIHTDVGGAVHDGSVLKAMTAVVPMAQQRQYRGATSGLSVQVQSARNFFRGFFTLIVSNAVVWMTPHTAAAASDGAEQVDRGAIYETGAMRHAHELAACTVLVGSGIGCTVKSRSAMAVILHQKILSWLLLMWH